MMLVMREGVSVRSLFGGRLRVEGVGVVTLVWSDEVVGDSLVEEGLLLVGGVQLVFRLLTVKLHY